MQPLQISALAFTAIYEHMTRRVFALMTSFRKERIQCICETGQCQALCELVTEKSLVY